MSVASAPEPTSVQEPPASSPSELTDQALSSLPYDSLIFDIGGVLLDFTLASESPLPPQAVKRIFHSPTWHDFERGALSEPAAYAALAAEVGHTADEVDATMAAMRKTLAMNGALIAFLHRWKRARPALEIYLMSNIAAPDWEYVRAFFKPDDLALFKRVFTSAAAGIRKPDVPFYELVLKETGVDPVQTLFVDDREENTAAARSVGLSTVTFKSIDDLYKHLRGDE